LLHGSVASPRNPLAHFAKGQLLRAMGRCGEAIREYEMALASNRNWASAIGHIGRCKIYDLATMKGVIRVATNRRNLAAELLQVQLLKS